MDGGTYVMKNMLKGALILLVLEIVIVILIAATLKGSKCHLIEGVYARSGTYIECRFSIAN